MNTPKPHYLLFCEAGRAGVSGRWRFVLRSADGSEHLEAADIEPKVCGERLDLLTLARGLESLDQPSQVTLIGSTRHVRQGVQYALPEWRSNGWRWEFFGEMVPVKNGDLWRRIDRALRYHRVECCYRRFDLSHAASPASAGEDEKHCWRVPGLAVGVGANDSVEYPRRPMMLRLARRVVGWLRPRLGGLLAVTIITIRKRLTRRCACVRP